MQHPGTWIIAALTILGILVRPKGWPEFIWACSGAALLLLFRLLTVPQAISAVRKGTDVYLFLTGMMLLAEMVRRQGLFEWLASRAVCAAEGSQERLFALVYGVGVIVTALLSNDATAVVLTPAVYAAVKKAGGPILPYVFICAFVANAASFVLPISNPANLVIFGSSMPPLSMWLKVFALPSAVSIIATYAVLRLINRNELASSIRVVSDQNRLSGSGRLVAAGILITATVLILASAFGRALGLPTCAAAVVVFATVVAADRSAFLPVLRHISWGVIPLVAGLFVMLEGLDHAGAVDVARAGLQDLASYGPWAAGLITSFATAAVCNIANNLPVGLLVSHVLPGHVTPLTRHAAVVGVDLGPNLSITGSLATILWLIALRRDGEVVTFGQFLKAGIAVTSPALALATCALFLGS